MRSMHDIFVCQHFNTKIYLLVCFMGGFFFFFLRNMEQKNYLRQPHPTSLLLGQSWRRKSLKWTPGGKLVWWKFTVMGTLGSSSCHICLCLWLWWSCASLLLLHRLLVLSPLSFSVIRQEWSKAKESKIKYKTSRWASESIALSNVTYQHCHWLITPACCLFCGPRHRHFFSNHIPDSLG